MMTKPRVLFSAQILMGGVGVFCTFLTLICDIQLIIVGTLPFMMPKILWLTGTHMSTIAGFVASLIAVLAAQLLKAGKISDTNARTNYKYTVFCRRTIICVAAAFHGIAVIFTICGLALLSNFCREFQDLMLNYHQDYSAKALVDNLQFALQCCGGHSYKDWYHVDWTQNDKTRYKLCVDQMLGDTNACAGLANIKEDVVPFSCCSRSATSPCVHRNLIQLGTPTINVLGCGRRLRSSALGLLCFEFVMYTVSLALEISIFLVLRRDIVTIMQSIQETSIASSRTIPLK